MVLEEIVVLMVDLGPSLISAHLLLVELEILAPSWAIHGAPTHRISTHVEERNVVLGQT
jgi:hypothetical protein